MPQESLIFTCSTAVRYVTVPASKLYYHFSEKGHVKNKEIFNLLYKNILEIWQFLVLNGMDIVPNCYFYLLAEV